MVHTRCERRITPDPWLYVDGLLFSCPFEQGVYGYDWGVVGTKGEAEDKGVPIGVPCIYYVDDIPNQRERGE
jgi:hypothetical protein